MKKSEYTRECLLRHPYLISKLLKDKAYDPKITKGILYQMIPFRSSIEIECIKSLSIALNIGTRKHNKYVPLTKKYDILSFDDDRTNLSSKIISEHRISIRNYSQAAGLYRILQDMKKYCILNPGSGIHIHIDASKIANNEFLSVSSNRFKIQKFLTLKLDELEEIFGKYNGTYNRKTVEFEHKGSWINIRYHSFNSIEFRIAPMTFDYETIIMWIIRCNKIVKELYKKLRISY